MKKLSAIFFSSATLCIVLAMAAQAATPKDVMLVLDNSGSMRKNDPQFLASGAIAAFINTLDSNYRAGVIIFDQKVKLAVPFTAVDEASKALLVASLDSINYRGQLTDSPAAVERAIYELKTNARAGTDQLIIFMTDGIVDTGNPAADVEKTKWLREELAVDAADNGIKVFAIAFTEHADFFLIQSLAKKTGGEYFRALTPADLGNVFSKLSEILNAPPPAPPPPVITEAPLTAATPPMAIDPPTVVTPLPDETVVIEALPSQASPQDLLATLSADERQELEEIAEQTGIPIEQLALELVGPEPQAGDTPVTENFTTPQIVYPEDQLSAEERSVGIAILVVAAVVLLILAALVVWFVMRRRGAKPADSATTTATQPETSEAAVIPEAFINDINGYTNDPALQLGDEPVMVGRVAGSDTEHLDYLVIDKGTVGRRHAVIKFKDFSFWIVDQGSVNGTFVNGQRISGEQQLKHGDKLRFHKYDFEFSQPDMDDGSHTVFAEPNAAEATIVASASTLAATSAVEMAASIDEASDDQADDLFGGDQPATADDDEDDMFGAAQQAVDLPLGQESPSAVFADSEIFDITGDTAPVAGADANASDAQASGDETFDDGETAIFDESPLQTTSATNVDLDEDVVNDDFDDEFGEGEAAIVDESPLQATSATNVNADEDVVNEDFDNEFDEDEEDLGVEINLEAVGAEDHPSLVMHEPELDEQPEDYDAEASAFFEDITVGPTPDDDDFDTTLEDEDVIDISSDDAQSSLEAKFDKASAILDNAEADDFGEMETVSKDGTRKADDTNDVTLDEFMETESFDAPKTIPPAIPKSAEDDAGDVTLEAFMTTSLFEDGIKLTNEDATVLPYEVPDEPNAGMDPGETVKLPRRPSFKDDDDDQDESKVQRS